jgi:hypothetical protein
MKTTESGLPLLNQEELETLIVKLKMDSSKKGLLVLGGVGKGKTTIMKKNLGAWISAYELGNITDPSNYQLEIRSILGKGACEWRTYITNETAIYPTTNYQPIGVFIDDLGTDKTINIFGNLINPLEFSIQHLYNNGVRLWTNTNLNMKELTEKYGLRIVSRLKEMCYVVVLDGIDYRDTMNDDLEQIKQSLES